MASVEGLAVALLAAGRSTRFGDEDKLAADLGGMSLIDWAADAGRSIPAAHRLLVRGSAGSTGPEGYQIVVNAHAEQGMATSLRIAARFAERVGASALLVLLADMPFVGAGHLGAILEAFAADPVRAIFSTAEDSPSQPPALFPACFFPALQALEGDRGARRLAKDVTLIATTPERLLDIDTPDDLARARDLLAAGTAPI